MREIETRSELMNKAENRFIQQLKANHYYDHEITSYLEMWCYGIQFAEIYPAWYSSCIMPPHEAKVLLYLDNDTIESYTFYYNNKELVQLFKNHVVAWMYQPPKPIFKDE